MKRWLELAFAIAQFVLLATAFYGGVVWCDRQHARAELADKTAALTATRKDLTDYHQQLQQAAAQFETDAAALRGIAETYANGRTQDEVFYQALGGKLDAYFTMHPDLAACDIGPVGLGLWNAANRGDAAEPGDGGTGAAVAEDRPQPAGAMSAAAAGDQRQAAGAGAQPRTGDAALQRLPQASRRAGDRGEDKRGAGGRAAEARAQGSAAARSRGHARAALIEGDTR